jgi:hypothetical protein
VDAAHILAWSKFGLDVVSNGLSLCKLHHWAFDAALILPVYDGSGLTLRFTELATESFSRETLSRLGKDGLVILEQWLPADQSLWPSKTYLAKLYADLAISFAT